MIKKGIYQPKVLVLTLISVCLSSVNFGHLYGQESSKIENSAELPPECLYREYQQILDSFYQSQQGKSTIQLKSRSNNDKFELRLYVDTSYERRVTGGYNNNDSVTFVLNKVVDSVRWLFNNASAYWDIDTETDVIFFDGATPFSYGANIVETLINFYIWLDSNNFPGNDDNYVFYTGNYTNQGVSFVGELCLPGVSLVGYVSNFKSNVDLSSHEWIGHSANSYHYNNEPNIMNSVAQRPWNSESIAVVDSFFYKQNCFINAQSSLSLDLFFNPINITGNSVSLDWSFTNWSELDYFIIERKLNSQDWLVIKNLSSGTSFKDYVEQNGVYQYRIQAVLKNNKRVFSNIQSVYFKNNTLNFIKNNTILNPEFKIVRIYDFTGRKLFQSRDSEIDLRKLLSNNYIIIQIETDLIKWFINSD
jgi:hypothetical protein